jgi:hypothetical protein
LLLALLAPRAAHAQFRDQLFTIDRADSLAATPPGALPRLRPWDGAQGGDDANTVRMILGGAGGGALGLVVGMAAGAVLDGPADEDCIDFCFGPGLVGGALLGEAVGMALGVHLADGRRGSLPMGLLTSAGILAVGLFAGQDSPTLILAIPVGQLIGTMTVERSTGYRR